MGLYTFLSGQTLDVHGVGRLWAYNTCNTATYIAITL